MEWPRHRLAVVVYVGMNISSRSSLLQSVSPRYTFQPLICWRWYWRLRYGDVCWREQTSGYFVITRPPCRWSTVAKPGMYLYNVAWEIFTTWRLRHNVLSELCTSGGPEQVAWLVIEVVPQPRGPWWIWGTHMTLWHDKNTHTWAPVCLFTRLVITSSLYSSNTWYPASRGLVLFTQAPMGSIIPLGTLPVMSSLRQTQPRVHRSIMFSCIFITEKLRNQLKETQRAAFAGWKAYHSVNCINTLLHLFQQSQSVYLRST